MTEAELYVVLRDLCIAVRGKWSVDRIALLARDLGIRRRRLDLQNAILDALYNHPPGTGSGTEMGTTLGTENAGSQEPLFSSPRPLSLTPPLTSVSGSLLRHFVPSSVLINAREEQKNTETTGLSEPSASWQDALKAEVKAMLATPLSALSVNQRYALARYHCMRFGNCSKMEPRNKYRATNLAPGIAQLAWHKDYGQITVKEYINAAAAVHEKRDEKPWFSPWSITAELENER